MSVAHQLDLDDQTSELLSLAAQRWPDWVGIHPALGVVDGLEELRPWLREAADLDQVDRVLHSLASLAAVDGGDDPAAAAALAWALLPGACTLARRLRTLTPEIDALVASQLWMEVRTFPWQRLSKVAANILMNTRAGVLREAGASSQLDRVDPTWNRTSTVDPEAPFWAAHATHRLAPEPTSIQELAEVLATACAGGVISQQDRTLLLCLVDAANRAPVVRTGRGHGGLMANEISELVAQRCGMSVRTVRRRALRSITALASACAHGEQVAT
jgi:hypothetical protein